MQDTTCRRQESVWCFLRVLACGPKLYPYLCLLGKLSGLIHSISVPSASVRGDCLTSEPLYMEPQLKPDRHDTATWTRSSGHPRSPGFVGRHLWSSELQSSRKLQSFTSLYCTFLGKENPKNTNKQLPEACERPKSTASPPDTSEIVKGGFRQ